LPIKHGMNQEKLKIAWNGEENPRKTMAYTRYNLYPLTDTSMW